MTKDWEDPIAKLWGIGPVLPGARDPMLDQEDRMLGKLKTTPMPDIGFKVFRANVEPQVYGIRREALEQFRQACGRGVWCEVWELSGTHSGIKIADFPGLA
jgi:hypothetical protein